MKRKLAACLMAAILTGAMGTGFAAALSPEQEEINLLKARLAALEEKVRYQEELATKQQEEVVKEQQAKKKREVEFGGDARVRFRDEGKGSKFDERFRFTVKLPVNDDAYFFSRWVMVNNNQFGATGDKDGGTVYNASMHFNNFLGEKGLAMEAGRVGLNVGATQYLLAESTGRMDGVKFTKKQKGLSYTLGYADFSAQSGKGDLIVATNPDKKGNIIAKLTPDPQLGESVFATVEYDASKATKLYGSYIKETSSSKGMKFDYRGIGVKTQLAENLKLLADYSYNNAYDDLNEGFYTSLRWRETSFSKPGSFEFRLDYRDIEWNNMYGTGLGNVSMPQRGYRGPGLSFLYVPVVNTRIALHQTFASKDADTGKGRDNFTRVDLQVKL